MELATKSPAVVSRPLAWDGRRTLHGRYLAGVALLVGLYYGSARLGYELNFSGPVAAIVWLPAGVGMAYLYLGGRRFWPGILIGDVLANEYSTLHLAPALGQTAGNLLEVLVGATLLARFARRGPLLDSVAGLGGMVAAIAAGTLVSAIIGPLSVRAGGIVTAGALPSVWRTWWLGDASGALLVVPLALAWYGRPVRSWVRGRAPEAAAMLATVAVTSEIAFRGARPLAYLAFPALAWAALRFGRRGATLAVAVAVGVGVWNTTHYEGPFAFHSITLSVLSTQLYIAVAALSTLCLAAVVSQREHYAERLDASRARLVRASELERRRLERDLHDGAQQRLSAVAIRLGEAADHSRDGPEQSRLHDAQAEIVLAMDELRELAHGIHPAVLNDFGLSPAIRGVALRSSVPVGFAELATARFDPHAELAAFYLFTEALANAQKHAHAEAMVVRTSATGGILRIAVSDDGVGGAVERPEGGLHGLRDRVEALGGRFELHSPPGAGTRISAAIPAPTRRLG
jgi:signal transduction histidine kinase